jgi:formate hydrogenlyase subunit 4
LLIVSTVVTSISGGMGGLFALIFLFGLGRFFLAVAGLEAGSAFGGMGSSREMFISALSEPAFFVAVFAALISQNPFSLSRLVAVAALFMVTIIETSRIPIDNQETHLELTMVHEAMVLEYSGRSLALIEFASHVKQIVMFSLLFTLIYSFMPAGFIQMYSATFYACFAGIILSITGAVALIEVTVAKMRLFRVPDFTTFAFVLSGTALVLAAAGL